MDREISLPFRLDNQGRVATTSNPTEAARQHLTSYLLTRPSERVMRPDFGTPLRDQVFEPTDPLLLSMLTTRVQEHVARDVRGVVLRGMGADDDSDQGAVTITVEFAVAVGAGEGPDQQTNITLGGGPQ